MTDVSTDRDRYREIYEWISANIPRALELCPYKIDGRHAHLLNPLARREDNPHEYDPFTSIDPGDDEMGMNFDEGGLL